MMLAIIVAPEAEQQIRAAPKPGIDTATARGAAVQRSLRAFLEKSA